MPNGNETLLCIDLDPSEVWTQQRFLKKNGYEIVTACSGPDGLRVLTAVDVDAIILRSYANLAESLVLAVALKQVKPQVPVVLVSENAELPENAFEVVDALVTRPGEPQVLLATLRSVLGAQRSAVIAGKNEISPQDKSEGRRVLEDLGALVETFAPRVRAHILAEVRSVFAALAQQICESVPQRPSEQVDARRDPAPDTAP